MIVRALFLLSFTCSLVASDEGRIPAATFDIAIASLKQQITYGADSSPLEKGVNVFWSDIASQFGPDVDVMTTQAVFAGLVDGEDIEVYDVQGATAAEIAAGTTVHNLAASHEALRQLMNGFVGANKDRVREACVKTGLSGMSSISTAVVVACNACGLQLHRSCAKACCKSDMTECMNSFCKAPMDSKTLLKRLTARPSASRRGRSRYKERLKESGGATYDARTCVVKGGSVFEGDCGICLEPLRQGKK